MRPAPGGSTAAGCDYVADLLTLEVGRAHNSLRPSRPEATIRDRTSCVVLLPATAAIVAACSDSTRPLTTVIVSFTSHGATLVAGDTLTAPATATDAHGRTLTTTIMSYTSSDTTVARVNAAGQVFALSPGRATIAATTLRHSGQLAVTVVLPTVQSVSFTVDTTSLMVDQQVAMAPVVTDVRGKTVAYPLRYLSSDARVATIDATGLATANGSATITAMASSAQATLAMTVLPQFRDMSVGGMHVCSRS